jgi:hypothetical protein
MRASFNPAAISNVRQLPRLFIYNQTAHVATGPLRPAMPTTLRTYDIGCEPSPSVPAETLIQDGWATYLLLFAVSKSVNETGYLKDLGVAVVECKNCSASKFGYPNDEGRPEHPLYALGLGTAESSILEVVGSTWSHEMHEQKIASSLRIRGGRNSSWKSAQGEPPRHFIILLKEKTFECLGSELSVEFFAKDFPEALEHVHRKLSKH